MRDRLLRKKPYGDFIGPLSRGPKFARLLDFFVERMATKSGIVFVLLETLRVRLEVLLRRVSRGAFAFFASFGAFKRNNTHFAFFLCHVASGTDRYSVFAYLSQ